MNECIVVQFFLTHSVLVHNAHNTEKKSSDNLPSFHRGAPGWTDNILCSVTGQISIRDVRSNQLTRVTRG